MRLLSIFLGMLFFPLCLLAANGLSVTEITEPYEVVALSGELSNNQLWLGELVGSPIMYEVELVASSTLSLRLLQPVNSEETTPFGLMVVEVDEGGGGVTEIARLRSEAVVWNRELHESWGFELYGSDRISREVGPGTYRIEVNTPINEGKYLLMFEGNDPKSLGYFTNLSQARAIQSYFEYSVFSLWRATQLGYPLGSILLLFAIWATWKYRDRIIRHA